MNSNKPFAEIIESNLQSFLGQCWDWNNTPSFGSLIAVENKKRTIFAIVVQIQTGSMDPTRYPFPYQKTHEELLAEQPQIFEFLKTTFRGTILGYHEKTKVYSLIPPEPPSIHSFIRAANTEESKVFFSNNQYLHLLFASQIPCLDELLLALLKHQSELKILKNDHLNDFIATFSLLSGNDYRRLKLFLARAESLI